jgi:hypothetical protein
VLTKGDSRDQAWLDNGFHSKSRVISGAAIHRQIDRRSRICIDEYIHQACKSFDLISSGLFSVRFSSSHFRAGSWRRWQAINRGFFENEEKWHGTTSAQAMPQIVLRPLIKRRSR